MANSATEKLTMWGEIFERHRAAVKPQTDTLKGAAELMRKTGAAHVNDAISMEAHRLAVSEIRVLEFLIAEATEYVVGGMEPEAAFLRACQTHEDMCSAGRGYNMGQHAERMHKLIDVACTVAHEKLSA